MKITKKRLKQIIQEELGRVMNENEREIAEVDIIHRMVANLQKPGVIEDRDLEDHLEGAFGDAGLGEWFQRIKTTYKSDWKLVLGRLLRKKEGKDEQEIRENLVRSYYGPDFETEYFRVEQEISQERSQLPAPELPPGPESYYGKGRYTGD